MAGNIFNASIHFIALDIKGWYYYGGISGLLDLRNKQAKVKKKDDG